MRTSFAQSSASAAEREFSQWFKLTQPEIRTPMKKKTHSTPHEPTEAEIQHAAYLLWVEAGQPAGHDQEHWFAARQMLLHRHGRDATTRRPAPEIAEPARR
jgi:hypothetical protein